MRRGLRVLHSSRGYIIRSHVIKMLQAVRILQQSARKFLVNNRVYWEKVRAALLFQAAWRGFQTRVEREDIVDYLSLKRTERFMSRAAERIQGGWRMVLISRRFRQMVDRAMVLQEWVRAKQARQKFIDVVRATRLLQRVGRGSIGRARVRDMRTINMVADELWRLKTVRERELLQLQNGTPTQSPARETRERLGLGKALAAVLRLSICCP